MGPFGLIVAFALIFLLPFYLPMRRLLPGIHFGIQLGAGMAVSALLLILLVPGSVKRGGDPLIPVYAVLFLGAISSILFWVRTSPFAGGSLRRTDLFLLAMLVLGLVIRLLDPFTMVTFGGEDAYRHHASLNLYAQGHYEHLVVPQDYPRGMYSLLLALHLFSGADLYDTVRFGGLFFSVVTILFVGGIGHHLHSPWAGVACAGLFAVFWPFRDVMTRQTTSIPETFTLPFYPLAFFALVQLMRDGSDRRWLWAGLGLITMVEIALVNTLLSLLAGYALGFAFLFMLNRRLFTSPQALLTVSVAAVVVFSGTVTTLIYYRTVPDPGFPWGRVVMEVVPGEATYDLRGNDLIAEVPFEILNAGEFSDTFDIIVVSPSEAAAHPSTLHLDERGSASITVSFALDRGEEERTLPIELQIVSRRGSSHPYYDRPHWEQSITRNITLGLNSSLSVLHQTWSVAPGALNEHVLVVNNEGPARVDAQFELTHPWGHVNINTSLEGLETSEIPVLLDLPPAATGAEWLNWTLTQGSGVSAGSIPIKITPLIELGLTLGPQMIGQDTTTLLEITNTGPPRDVTLVTTTPAGYSVQLSGSNIALPGGLTVVPMTVRAPSDWPATPGSLLVQVLNEGYLMGQVTEPLIPLPIHSLEGIVPDFRSDQTTTFTLDLVGLVPGGRTFSLEAEAFSGVQNITGPPTLQLTPTISSIPVEIGLTTLADLAVGSLVEFGFHLNDTSGPSHFFSFASTITSDIRIGVFPTEMIPGTSAAVEIPLEIEGDLVPELSVNATACSWTVIGATSGPPTISLGVPNLLPSTCDLEILVQDSLDPSIFDTRMVTFTTVSPLVLLAPEVIEARPGESSRHNFTLSNRGPHSLSPQLSIQTPPFLSTNFVAPSALGPGASETVAVDLVVEGGVATNSSDMLVVESWVPGVLTDQNRTLPVQLFGSIGFQLDPRPRSHLLPEEILSLNGTVTNLQTEAAHVTFDLVSDFDLAVEPPVLDLSPGASADVVVTIGYLDGTSAVEVASIVTATAGHSLLSASRQVDLVRAAEIDLVSRDVYPIPRGHRVSVLFPVLYNGNGTSLYQVAANCGEDGWQLAVEPLLATDDNTSLVATASAPASAIELDQHVCRVTLTDIAAGDLVWSRDIVLQAAPPILIYPDWVGTEDPLALIDDLFRIKRFEPTFGLAAAAALHLTLLGIGAHRRRPALRALAAVVLFFCWMQMTDMFLPTWFPRRSAGILDTFISLGFGILGLVLASEILPRAIERGDELLLLARAGLLGFLMVNGIMLLLSPPIHIRTEPELFTEVTLEIVTKHEGALDEVILFSHATFYHGNSQSAFIIGEGAYAGLDQFVVQDPDWWNRDHLYIFLELELLEFRLEYQPETQRQVSLLNEEALAILETWEQMNPGSVTVFGQDQTAVVYHISMT